MGKSKYKRRRYNNPLGTIAPPKGTVCPDCAGTTNALGQLAHSSGCPLFVGYQRAADDDAQWFRLHPSANERRRPPTMAEVLSVSLMMGLQIPDVGGAKVSPAGEVVVTQRIPGVRYRDFSGAWLLVEPAS